MRPPSTSSVAAIVLAAGASRRMGESKALLDVHGRPMIARVVESVLAVDAIASVVVVTGFETTRLHSALASLSGVQFVHNDSHATTGMLESVKCGLTGAALDSRGFLIALADQPAVRPTTIAHLINSWSAATEPRPRVALPLFNHTRGHPVLLDAIGREEILDLSAPDATLKSYTSKYKSATIEVPVDDPAVLEDIDTPADYHRLLKRWDADVR